MTREEFIKTWNGRSDGETEIDFKGDEGFFLAGGYAFVVQSTGNIVMKQVAPPSMTLLSAMKAFRHYLVSHGIQYVRIEGNTRRYRFLPKAFPGADFRQDDTLGRNVFYAKVF